ncbi:hypothetical protein C5B85_10480 [Pseudoclavibacter sp. AY1F1]|uniref:hypothetical protein n=1 Tax=Pseudoclavibacter sp. AY1F1 TaxID=2080583 RepID=UPI000CE784BC|nr:hypothetical protein [Pseudoclavibacter sp. AY1F1]PPF44552.1 hypothetical protein C5B85_10480 [Pseudoclavibacter sp. AY1F1]
MTNQTWCIAGGEDGADRRLADALLRGGNTVAIVGRDVAPFALLVDDYADAIMPVEITATTSEALAEVRRSIELNLGEVTHFGVLLGGLGEGTAEEVAERLVGKLARASRHRDAEGGDAQADERWPADAQLILVRGTSAGEDGGPRAAENSDIEARIRFAAEQTKQPMPSVRVRELEELIRGESAVALG